jgi:hypothetical protein
MNFGSCKSGLALHRCSLGEQKVCLVVVEFTSTVVSVALCSEMDLCLVITRLQNNNGDVYGPEVQHSVVPSAASEWEQNIAAFVRFSGVSALRNTQGRYPI